MSKRRKSGAAIETKSCKRNRKMLELLADPISTTYVALLRGINVGGIKIKMTALKTLFEELNFRNVHTVLATGNVIFSNDQNDTQRTAKQLKDLLEDALSDLFNYRAFVQIYELSVIKTVVETYKLEKCQGFHAYCVFVSDEKIYYQLRCEADNIVGTVFEGESFRFCSNDRDYRVVLWNVPIGYTTKSEFAKLIAKSKFKNAVTTRNINTLEKILVT